MTKLWDKGDAFSTISKDIEQFTVGNDYLLDRKLVAYDAEASSAHVAMLVHVNLLTKEEGQQITKVLEEIKKQGEEGTFEIKPQDEDCHTAIENYLVAKLGETGKKVHTGRSRNDQVLAALRLYAREQVGEITKQGTAVIQEIKNAEKKWSGIQIPGYTHMQRAMPYSLPLWLGAIREALEDDLAIVKNIATHLNQSPLGAAAGYGVPVLGIWYCC